MNIDLVKRFADLDQQRKALEDALKEVKSKITVVEQEALDEMGEEGIAALKVTRTDGSLVTVRVDRKIWASAKEDQHGVAQELEAIGLGDFVNTTVHGGRLSSWIREQFDPTGDRSPDEINEHLPDGLRDRLTISEKINLRSR